MELLVSLAFGILVWLIFLPWGLSLPPEPEKVPERERFILEELPERRW
ncbi:MAG: hypothetical protein Q7R93_05300 [bacterium]|nr:hypothetical protein [bacterium]